jgi:hypothetical protein
MPSGTRLFKSSDIKSRKNCHAAAAVPPPRGRAGNSNTLLYSLDPSAGVNLFKDL